MEQTTTIFLGPQGSGKGTQVKLWSAYLKANDSSRGVVHFDAGAALRAFGEQGGHTQDIVNASLKRGELQPMFVLARVWSDFFIDRYRGGEHVIVDGFPRTDDQLRLFNSAIEFYKLKPAVIFIALSEESSIKRLLGRGRNDDTPEGIRTRLGWYQEKVGPIVDWLRNCQHYRFFDIDGEPSPEEIHKAVVSKLTAV